MEVEPKLYRAIMVSSTFTDLEAHRREVIDAIHRFGFQANVMEYSGAGVADVIATSLQMVQDSVAYLCLIGHKYGQTPADPDRNPKGLSITELEFNEARRLGRPILLFLMAKNHPVTPDDVELDRTKRKKLDAFKKQAKRVDPAAPVERVYETFASVEEFAKKAAIAIGLQAIRMTGASDVPDRAIRDAIARFIDVKPDAKQSELTEAIDRFEIGYRALQQQLAAIPVNDNRVTSLKAAAEAALAEGDLDKARTAYREAAEAARDKLAEPVRTAADLKAAEAEAHLLALDWEAADAAWAEAAAMLTPFDPGAASKLIAKAAERLAGHGKLYARVGAVRTATDRWYALTALAEELGEPSEAALLQYNLGLSLKMQGEITDGGEGLHLLQTAVIAYRKALTVYTRAEAPSAWASIQNNLGNALRNVGDRTSGTAGLRVLEEAVTAFRNALTVRTRADMPVDWARSQQNLGNALANQGERTVGTKGLQLLDEAVTALRGALTVRTRADMPVQWAMTHNNLGGALRTLGDRTDGPASLGLLEEAVESFNNALTVRTRRDMPAAWAMTQQNIGLAFESMPGSTRAARSSTSSRPKRHWSLPWTFIRPSTCLSITTSRQPPSTAFARSSPPSTPEFAPPPTLPSAPAAPISALPRCAFGPRPCTLGTNLELGWPC